MWWSISARVAFWSRDEVILRPFSVVRRVCLARPALADTVLSVAAITGSGEASNLDRRLARMSGTTFSWRGTPKPPSTTWVWKKRTGVSCGDLNQDRKADLTIRWSHFRYLADVGAMKVCKCSPSWLPQFLHCTILVSFCFPSSALLDFRKAFNLVVHHILFASYSWR